MAAAAAGGSNDGRRVRQRRGSGHVSAVVALPPLLQVLGGNSATTAMVLACFNSDEASALRQLHPAVAAVVSAVPWADTDTIVFDVVRWRASLPAAVAAKVCRLPEGVDLAGIISVALAGVQRLVLQKLDTMAALARLPTSLHSLHVESNVPAVVAGASLSHLTALASLICSAAAVGEASRLPPSLRELRISSGTLPPAADFRHLHALQRMSMSCIVSSIDVFDSLPPSLVELRLFDCKFLSPHDLSLSHLTRLRVLHAVSSTIHAGALAALPPCIVELTLRQYDTSLALASFTHLIALQELDFSECDVSDAVLLRLPPSLETLHASDCKNLTPAAVLPTLPALAELDVSNTEVGDALIASLPASLVTLHMTNCRKVTHDASFGHLPALRELHNGGADLSPTEVAACRARGCFVPAAGVLRGHGGDVRSLAVLPDGRLASGDSNGIVRLWDMARGGEATAALKTTHGWAVRALAALPGGKHLAVGEDALTDEDGGLEIWDVSCAPRVRCGVVGFDAGVRALAVLRNRRLAVACNDRDIRVLRFDDGGRMGEPIGVSGHTASVNALAVLHDGSLASASADGTVRVWDGRKLRCRTVLGGHLFDVVALAVLPDGCLASLSKDATVRLWDVGAGTCVRVLTGVNEFSSALAALPDGRLAGMPVTSDTIIQVWDTRPHCRAARANLPTTLLARCCTADPPNVLLSLPGGLLASSGAEGDTAVYLWHLPGYIAPPPPP